MVCVSRSVVCEATYPDGRRNLSVRVVLDRTQLHRALQPTAGSTPQHEIENARKHICIHVKKAIHAEYKVKRPAWIEWSRLRITVLHNVDSGSFSSTADEATQRSRYHQPTLFDGQ